MAKLIGFSLFIAAAVLLSACASAPGPRFSGLVTPEANEAGIYLFRRDQIAGVYFPVRLDDESVVSVWRTPPVDFDCNA